MRPPRITERPVAFEGETYQLIPIGAHTLVLAKVLEMHVRDDCVLDAARQAIDTARLGLVGRMHGRGWYARTTDLVELSRVTAAGWQARKAENRMRIALIATGEMGAAIAARLRRHGAEVATSLAGRSEASAARAKAAGLLLAADDAALLAKADLFLSVVPPGQALALAERLAPVLARIGGMTDGRLLYADCNAVAPETVRRIAGVVTAAGCRFADVGIIGAPPGASDPGPRLYAAGDPAVLERLAALQGLGLDLRCIAGGVGAASALKLAYATLTKGLTALGSLAALSSSAAAVAGPLRAELARSQPELAGWLARQLPAMPPKAHRWVAEMEEIARFLESQEGGALGEAAATFKGAARLYEQIAKSREADGPAALLLQFYAPERG